MKPSDWAWLALAIGIISYEVAAPRGELMSEGWDRYLERRPVLARLFPVVVTLHVINALPRWVDPVSGVFTLARAVGESVTTYIAGPMTGIEEFNFPAFHAEAARQRALGFEVINPAELDAEVGPDHPWDFYLRRDLKVLAECDRVVLLPGWQASRGAQLECHVAASLGMEIVYP